MLAAQSPITFLNDSLRPRTTGRIPLQPKNTPCNHSPSKNAHTNPKPNPDKLNPISPINYFSNKENHPDLSSPSPPPPITKTEEVEVSLLDPSLAEELNAVRKRLDKLRPDRATTERMLKLRDRIFEIRLEELLLRGEFQKQLENEVDRLYRLKQLQLHSTRKSPIRSLRERETQKRSNESPLQSENSRKEESVDRSVTLTLNFSSQCTSDL